MNRIIGSFIYERRSRNSISSLFINNATRSHVINRSIATSPNEIDDFIGEYSEISFEENREVNYFLVIRNDNLHYQLDWQNEKRVPIFTGRGIKENGRLVGYYTEV